MDPDIENLMREAEQLIAEVENGNFDSWCKSMGFNAEKVRQQLVGGASTEAEKQARELFADDLADVNRDIESRAAELGLVREQPSAQASAVRQRRRLGMV